MDSHLFGNGDNKPEKTIGIALNIRREPGPPMLEESYRACLADEIGGDGIQYESDVTIAPGASRRSHRRPMPHYCADARIDGRMIVEMKSQEPGGPEPRL